MLKIAMRQRAQFALVIIAGFVLFFCLLPWGHDRLCSSIEQSTSAAEDYDATQQHQEQSGAAILNSKGPNKPQNAAANDIRNVNWPANLFCSEMKLTDLALAFFTCTLAAIGWFSLRSTENIAEAIERAYIFHGYSSLEFRGNEARFILFMRNAGRMPAGVKKVGYKFLARSNLPARRDLCDWEWNQLPYDLILRPEEKHNIGKLISLQGNQIFVSFVEYKDMFTMKVHTSWMGMHINPNNPEGERASRAGGDEWNAWD
jgi:hypothetical protein